MTLLLVFLLLTVGLTALFLGVTVIAQGYLYQEPAARLPLRAAAAGLLLGGFLTLWAALDKSKPGRYDTLFTFAPYTTVEFNEFEAVRWPAAGGKLKTDEAGKPVEDVVKFKQRPGGKDARFVREGTSEVFNMNTGSYMTGAIRVKGPDDPEPVRYNAYVNENPLTKQKEYPRADRRFEEDGGSRYVMEAQLGTLFVPSNRTVVIALTLNFLLAVLWLAATWPLLRYSFVHALGLTAVGTLVCMLILLPLLFRFNRPPEPRPAPPPGTAPAVAPAAPGA